MSDQITTQLLELVGLWIEATPDSLNRVPALCNEIAARAEDIPPHIETTLLNRARILSARAGERLTQCVAIQTRTGSYSVSGALECSAQVVTSGWEG